MSKLKVSLMLLALVIFGVFIFREEQNLGGEKIEVTQDEKSIPALAELQRDELDSISIVGPQGVISLNKNENDIWQIKQAANAPAEPLYIDLVVETLTNLSIERVISDKDVSANQSIYGLIPPAIVVSVKSGSKKTVMSFGASNALSGARYLQLEGSADIYTVAESDFAVFDKPLSEVRRSRVMMLAPSDIQSLTVRNEYSKPYIIKSETEQLGDIPTWSVIVDGESFPADGDQVRNTVESVVKAESLEFLDEVGGRLAFYGLAKPALTLRLDFADSLERKPLVALFGKGVGKNFSEQGVSKAYYMKIAGEPWVSRLERSVFSDLLKPASHFRQRALFSLVTEPEIKELVIASSKGKIRLSRQSLGQPLSLEVELDGTFKPRALDDRIFNAWLEQLFSAKVLTFLGEDVSVEDGERLALSLEMSLFDSESKISSAKLLVKSILPESNPAEMENSAASVSPRRAEIQINGADSVRAVLSGDTVRRIAIPKELFVKEK